MSEWLGRISREARLRADWLRFRLVTRPSLPRRGLRLNLCAGPIRIPGWISIDIQSDVDIKLDLARSNLPFDDGSAAAVACISAINYFTHVRAAELVQETHRVLQPGGVARFAVQDMALLAKRYVERDTAFFDQRLANGRPRFEGETMGDRFVAWFYGYRAGGTPCRYAYDFESLARLFARAGFSAIEQRPFRSSQLVDVEALDNRPDQMFFLEATK
jgi:predicted SAM-dependent methyltransferase